MSDVGAARPGQSLLEIFRAGRINGWDQAAAQRARGAGGLFDPAVDERDAGIVRVRNTSGADRDQFAIVGLDAPIIAAGDNLPEFHRQGTHDFVSPAWPGHYSRYAVLQEPVRNGAIGRARVAGVTSCKINFADSNAATGHQYATLKNAEYGYLDSAPCGVARILARESGTGEKWCKLLLGCPPPAGGLARTPGGGISAASGSNFPYTPGSGSCDQAVWSGGDLVDANWNITIYNFAGGAIGGNKLIVYNFDDVGRAWFVSEYCAPA